MELKPLRVSEVNQYIRRILTSDPILHNVKIEGEISNFKHHYSGHMYFTLKDESSRLKCVMFESEARNLEYELDDGMNVILTGSISVYEKDGSYQLYVKRVVKKGLGELHLAFEQLKKKLENEGLFDSKHKKDLPFLPKKIGVVTSTTGAAVRDIVTVLKRRFPYVEILIYPSLVQGPKAYLEICKALNYFNSRQDIDIIIIGRGGGSLEELWAFNEEEVARTLFQMNIPVISAVGHETDFTISDFVADLRAPTPSVAGELAVPLFEDIKYRLDEVIFRLQKAQRNHIKYKKSLLDMMNNKIMYNNPSSKTMQQRQQLDNLFKDLNLAIQHKKENMSNQISTLGGKLNTLSPLAVVNRGYTITTNSEENIIKSVKDIKVGDKVSIRLKDGKVEANVIDIKISN